MTEAHWDSEGRVAYGTVLPRKNRGAGCVRGWGCRLADVSPQIVVECALLVPGAGFRQDRGPYAPGCSPGWGAAPP